MPKERWKRILFRLKPSELYHYWFSRDGVLMALKITGVGIVLCFILVVGMFAYFRKNLPDLKNISGVNIGGSTTYTDRTGKVVLFQDYDSNKRIPVRSDQISKYMNEATVAIEDRGFYSEGAFNVRGIIRAGFHDIFGGGGGGGLQGGSTITQQLVKLNMNWTSQRSFAHKIEELILAVDVSREYTKSEILTGYENIAPYENSGYGVQVAAQDYFKVDASQLSLAQAAFLAAIPQNPSHYSPYSSPTYNSALSTNRFASHALIQRQQYVLDQMVKSGYITADQAAAAKAVDILAQVHPQTSKYSGIKEPYYVLAAKHALEDKYGTDVVQRGGWTVTTALDMNLQTEADNDVQNNRNNKAWGNTANREEAMVGEDVQTGQIVSLVGGVDFNNPKYGQINYATNLTSPGSSFKPMDYLTFIETTGAGAGSVLYDVQQPLTGYKCTDKTQPTATSNGGNCLWDYDYDYPGPLSIRYALPGSRNVTAVKAMLGVDPSNQVAATNKVIATANAMMNQQNGYQCYKDSALTTPTQCYGSSAIGDGAFLQLDHEVNYDASLGRLGASIPTTYILKITDSNNNTVYQWKQPKATQAVRPDSAYIIDNVLSDPNATYLRKEKQFQNSVINGATWDIAIKTGTQFENHHGLMTAWSKRYAVVTWVGTYNDTDSLPNGHMEDLTEPLAKPWMLKALSSLNLKTADNWQAPPGIQTLPSYVQTNFPAKSSGAHLTGNTTDIFPSWYVPKSGAKTASQKFDAVSGNLATSCTPSLAIITKDGSTGSASVFSVDPFYPPTGSAATTTNTDPTNASANDSIHNCSDSLPQITLTPTASTNPNTYDFTVAITKGTFALSGGNYTTAPAGTVTLSINGNVVQTVSIPTDASTPWNYTFSGVSVNNGDTVQAQVVDSVLYASQTAAQTAPFGN